MPVIIAWALGWLWHYGWLAGLIISGYSLFSHGRAHAASGDVRGISLNLALCLFCAVCAFFPKVRTGANKFVLGPAWKGLKLWGSEIEAESNK